MNNIRLAFLLLLKAWGYIIYSSKLKWIGSKDENWDDVSLILILNHTSLFKFVYADKTMNKKIGGFVFKHLAPKTISLTKKRDDSLNMFLDSIMPEGQMKRKSGLDKNGNPMRGKTGVYELLKKYQG